MTTPNHWSKALRAAGRWRALVWGMLAVGGAGAVFALGVMLSRVAPQPPATAAASPPLANVGASPQAATNASAASATFAAAAFSTTPVSADALGAIDLDALLTQDDLLPTGYAVLGRPSQRLPDTLRNVPEPVQVRAASLTLSGVSAGNIAVLLYPSIQERDVAETVLAQGRLGGGGNQVYEFAEIEAPGFSPSPPLVAGVGERALGQSAQSDTSNDFGGTTSIAKVVFMRCGAVVHIRLASTTTREDLQPAATEIAQMLDQQLALLVCQAP